MIFNYSADIKSVSIYACVYACIYRYTMLINLFSIFVCLMSESPIIVDIVVRMLWSYVTCSHFWVDKHFSDSARKRSQPDGNKDFKYWYMCYRNKINGFYWKGFWRLYNKIIYYFAHAHAYSILYRLIYWLAARRMQEKWVKFHFMFSFSNKVSDNIIFKCH